MRTIRRVGVRLGDEKAFMGNFVLHGGDVREWVEPAEVFVRDSERMRNACLHLRKHSGQHGENLYEQGRAQFKGKRGGIGKSREALFYDFASLS